ncbi:LVIVD repeat-containing protein [Geodermatophilus sp. CPCC 206100]|uniref:LVIVD repeat-containing protein n=1 Tax=Geodermatophilus sp. CPCC 206100 TaxID=3020054 RepID=UPI003AFF8360
MTMAPDRAPGVLECEGFELVGYCDLGKRPGFKLALTERDGRWFLYTGHLWESGWSVVDVTDPAAPRVVHTMAGPETTWTIQVQAADGLLVTALERPVPGWGVPEGAPYSEGVLLWDLTGDPAEPELVGEWRTGSYGTHRNFYAGGRHAYLTAAGPDVVGQCLVILDVSDPAAPREVSRWAWPDQLAGTGEPPLAYLHGPAYVSGDLAYLPYGRVGLVVLDVSDVRSPRLVSVLGFGDLGSFLGLHSAVPIPERDLLVVNSEAIEEHGREALNYAFVVDVADPSRPRVLSSLPVPRPGPGLPYPSYYDKGGRFGPHNQHHHQGNPAHFRLREHVLMTYFNAGLRLFDISDAREPREVGWFVPEDPAERRGVLPTELATQFEDVVVDARGYVYCTDKNHGVFVLRYAPGLR